MRGPTRQIGSNYQLFSWADEGNTGTVDINDLAKAAVNFCKNPAAFPGPGCPADAYFGNPLLGIPGQVNINDIAAIATYFDVSLTSPIAPAQVLGLDSVIDYFDYDGTGGIGPYCSKQSSTQAVCYTDSPPDQAVCPLLPARSNAQKDCEAMDATGLGFSSYQKDNGLNGAPNIPDPNHAGYFLEVWIFTITAPGIHNVHWTPGCNVGCAQYLNVVNTQFTA
jgi:hypothetical protein